MNDRPEVELDRAPDLRRLYARGVADTVGALGRSVTVTEGDLPDEALVLRGVWADVDRLTAYQRLVDEPVSDALPAGFVHVLTFPIAIALMVRADFPLPLIGMVHLANRVTQHRVITADEPLDLEVHATGLRQHRAGVSVDLVARARVHDGVVWQGASTYLAKGARMAGAGAGELADERSAFVAPVPTGQWRFDADAGRRYAAVSGDRNPMHTSRLAARAFGFPGRIAHGMYTAARALAAVGSSRGAAFDWAVEFARPVLLPSSVTVRVAPDDDGFVLAAWDARSGKPHLTGAVRPTP